VTPGKQRGLEAVDTTLPSEDLEASTDRCTPDRSEAPASKDGDAAD
jgi:hypothetical protein